MTSQDANSGTVLPVHARIPDFAVRDNCLVVGSKKLTEIADAVGQTPFYVYDSTMIAARIRALRNQLPKNLQLHYAIKANPMTDVVNFIAPLVDGLDVASAREMEIAIHSGMDCAEISFAGPGKRSQELEEAIEAGITITIESAGELERLRTIANRLGRKPRVCVRVNPDFELRASGMKMSGGPKPFGIDAEVVPEILDTLAHADLQFVGLHIFCGSQNLKEDAIIDAQSKTVDLALRLLENCEAIPEFINIGGGFGIPYFKGDDPLSLDRISDNLSDLGRTMAAKLPGCKMVIELGRYIVGECGLYVCRVVDRKISRGVTYLVADGGLHHHLAASGNFGQVIRKNYPVVIGNNVFSDAVEQQTIVGPLCTPLDILGDNMALPPADVGDLIVLFQSGAYGYSASPHNFLSHPGPVEVLV